MDNNSTKDECRRVTIHRLRRMIKTKKDRNMNPTLTRYEAERLARTVVEFFEAEYADFEERPDALERDAKQLTAILGEAEGFIADASRNNEWRLPAYMTRSLGDDSLIYLSQLLGSYLGILAAVNLNEAEFERRLVNAVTFSLDNVDYAQGLLNPDEPAPKPIRFGRFWVDEPLSIFACFAAHLEKSREIAGAYERYIGQLEDAPFGNCVMRPPFRSQILHNARSVHSLLLSYVIDEILPAYPLDFGPSDAIREAVVANPDLPIIVLSGPKDTDGAYCEIERVEVTQVLNRKTSWWPLATVATSRAELVGAIENEIRYTGCVEGFEPDWNDEQIAAAAEEEAAKLDDDWIPVIAIRATWEELCDVPF